jgi:signal transduction histidine kinase
VKATVRYEPRRLELEIRGEGPLPGVGESMQSVTARVELYGGELEIQPAEGDGFAVRCRLPLEGTLST